MFVKHNIYGLIWGIIVLLLSILPGNYFPEVSSFWELFSPDKIIHLFIFGVLTILLIFGFRKQNTYKMLQIHFFFFATTIGIIYGLTTELLQLIMNNGRHASFYDFVADSVGCLIGLIICRAIIKKKNKNFNHI